MKGAAEQADAADEGRLAACGSMVAGLFCGSAVIVGEGKVVRPSQLIRGVRPTCGEFSTWEPPRAWTRRAR